MPSIKLVTQNNHRSASQANENLMVLLQISYKLAPRNEHVVHSSGEVGLSFNANGIFFLWKKRSDSDFTQVLKLFFVM